MDVLMLPLDLVENMVPWSVLFLAVAEVAIIMVMLLRLGVLPPVPILPVGFLLVPLFRVSRLLAIEFRIVEVFQTVVQMLTILRN